MKSLCLNCYQLTKIYLKILHSEAHGKSKNPTHLKGHVTT